MIPKNSHKIHCTGQKLIITLEIATYSTLIFNILSTLFIITSFPTYSLLPSRNTKGHIYRISMKLLILYVPKIPINSHRKEAINDILGNYYTIFPIYKQIS